MNSKKMFFCCAAALVLCLLPAGCSKKPAVPDENKPISEIKAEASTMTVQQLRDMAAKYKNLITAALADKDTIDASMKNISAEDMIKKAQDFQAQLDKIQGKISALKERLQVYLDQLKKKGESITGLEIN